MSNNAFAPSAQAPGMATKGLPSASRAPCVGSLAASGPAKVAGWKIKTDGESFEPTDLWGTCG